MALPQIPIQTGSALPSLDREEDVQLAADQDAEIANMEEAMGLDPVDAEQAVIEILKSKNLI